MLGYTIIGGVIVVGLAMIKDAAGTVQLVTVIITTRGVTWVVRKIIDTLDNDRGQMINFVGWSIAGVAALKIIKNAVAGVQPVIAVCGRLGDAVQGIGRIIDSIVQFADKVTFWN